MCQVGMPVRVGVLCRAEEVGHNGTHAAFKEQLLGQPGIIAEGAGCFVPVFTGTAHAHVHTCGADGLGLVLELSIWQHRFTL